MSAPTPKTTTLDRITQTQRPNRPVAGTQQWRNLLFMHWPVDVAALRALVPPSLELDLWDGTALLGLVPFEMHNIAPRWWPHALAFHFLETNLRTYVHVNGEPGVYFFSLEASSLLAVMAARAGFRLPYFPARMSRQVHASGVRYQTHRTLGGPALLDVTYKEGVALGRSTPGSLQHFLLERYLLFTVAGSTTWRGQVFHTPYPVHAATVDNVNETLLAAAGLPAAQGAPWCVHASPGVDVEVFALERV